MLRQCPLGISQQLQYHAIAVPTAMQDRHIDKVRSSAVGKQLKQKKSNLQGQLHLPPLDLFWALWRVQHHPPLRRLDPRHAMDSRTHTTVSHGPQRKHALAKIKSALWTTKWTTLCFLGPQKQGLQFSQQELNRLQHATHQIKAYVSVNPCQQNVQI